MSDTGEARGGEQVRYFACPDAIRLGLGGDVLSYSGVLGRTDILTGFQASLLDACRVPRTLDEHATLCRRAHPSRSADEIRDGLTSLVEGRHLLPESFLRERVRARADGAETPGRIDFVGVVTRDRPRQLRQCLDGYISNARGHGRSVRYVVADDTGDPRARDETRHMLRELGAQHDVEITYLGLEEKRSFAARLAAAGDLPAEVLDFCLFGEGDGGVSIGANRNALLLYTAGRLALSTDDDVFCRVAPGPGAEGVPAVGGVDGFTQFWFFPDRESALRAAEAGDLDLLALHEQMLGADAAEYLTRASGGAAFFVGDLDPPLFRSLVAEKIRIRLTYMGTVGDSAFRSPGALCELEGPSLGRLLESEDYYRQAARSREVWRTVTRPVVTRHSRCMTGAFAYDNRALLPPFFPVHRNEDGVYGQTLRHTLGDACYGHLPYALLHDPPGGRVYEGAAESASYLHSSHLVIAGLNSLGPAHRLLRPEQSLRRLGEHMSIIGDLPPADFEEFARVHLLRLRSSRAAALEGLLRRHRGAPAYWVRDVEQYLAALRRGLLMRDGIYPDDLSEGRGGDEALRLLGRQMSRFGQLLYWWPAAVEAALKVSEVK